MTLKRDTSKIIHLYSLNISLFFASKNKWFKKIDNNLFRSFPIFFTLVKLF